MGERDTLAANLRQLLELDRGLGIEFRGRGGKTRADGADTAVTDPTRVAEATRGADAYRPAVTEPPTVPPPAAAPVPAVALTPAAALAEIAAQVAACRACGLCATRTTTVPGEGAAVAEVVFVGEGPGADEDAQGRPFVGAAGQLLTRMIEAMGFRRDEVFICNVIKCRPPANRTPEAGEVAACLGYLHRQLDAIRPRVICTLGNTPLRALLEDESLGITRQRGKRFAWRGIPLIPTFHPAYLLRNPDGKKPCWEDLKQVLAVIGRTPPQRT